VLLIRQLQKYQAPFRSCKKALIPILDFISIGYAVTVNLFISKVKLTTPIKSYIDLRIGTGLTTIAIIRILKMPKIVSRPRPKLYAYSTRGWRRLKRYYNTSSATAGILISSQKFKNANFKTTQDSRGILLLHKEAQSTLILCPQL